VNEQYDANGPVDRRETSSLLMSTCPVTRTLNVIQEHKLHTKTTNWCETTIKLLHRIKHWLWEHFKKKEEERMYVCMYVRDNRFK